MRLFVAIWPSAEAIAELQAAAAGVRARSEGPEAATVRWTAPTQWHLTLAFLGEVGEDRLPDLQQRLARAAGRRPAPTLAFAGASRFGDRVLFAKVIGDGGELRHLAGSITAAVRRSGLPVDERPYRAHLTLARGRPGSDLRPLVAALAEFRGRWWTSRHLHLVRSRLGVGPDRASAYETLQSWPLAGGTSR